MTGASLPFRALIENSGPGSDAFLARLAEAGVQSIELRTVPGSADPDTVLAVIRRIQNAGMRVSVHSAPRSAAAAVNAVFSPLSAFLKDPGQEDTILVLHPVRGEDIFTENRSMLAMLADYVRTNGLSVKLALENNRQMPDRSPGDSADLVRRLILETDPEICGLCFDLGHYAWVKKVWETPSPVLPPEDFLKRVIHTHIHALAGPELDYTTHFPLQTGCLPLKEYLGALGKDYRGAYNVELEPERFTDLMSGEEAIAGSVEVLKKALE